MNIYTVKVVLRGISPMIWRHLSMAGNASLADLHHIIQTAMGWDDEYLHCFHIYGKDYGIQYPGGLGFADNPWKVYLDDFGFDPGDRFTYTYNFYENWLNDIRIETIVNQAEIASSSVSCIGGKGRLCEAPYDQLDERTALANVLDKIAYPGKSTTIGDIRALIEDYNAVRYDRRSINKNLKEAFEVKQ